MYTKVSILEYLFHLCNLSMFFFQALLCEPDLDSACILNQQAAYHYVHARHTYNQLVYDCVTASLRIQGNNDHDSLHQVNTVCVTC